VAKWVNMREKRLPFAAAMPHGVAAPADGRWDTAFRHGGGVAR
jgi:hypothetical protein